eukprot:scaffold124251_cov36-Tisochrysis_lutea.AAC.5
MRGKQRAVGRRACLRHWADRGIGRRPAALAALMEHGRRPNVGAHRPTRAVLRGARAIAPTQTPLARSHHQE